MVTAWNTGRRLTGRNVMKMNVNCLQMSPGFVLVSYGKTHRNGNGCREGQSFYYTGSHLGTGGVACHAGPHGEALGSGRRQREPGEMWARAFIVVSLGKGKTRQDELV